MPTRRGFSLLGAGLVLVVAGRFLALNELGTVGLALIAVVSSSVLFVFAQRFRAKRIAQISFTRVAPQLGITANLPFAVTLAAQAKRNRVPLCQVRESLRRSSDRTRGKTLNAQGSESSKVASHFFAHLCRTGELRYQESFARGTQRLGPGRVTISDPLALASIAIESIPVTEIVVWPEVVDLVPGTLLRVLQTAEGDSDTEPGDLRTYVVGDDLRRVHWASSARTNTLIVRGTDRPRPTMEQFRITLDMNAGSYVHPSFELALSVVSSLLLSREADDRIELCLEGQRESIVYSGLHEALNALAKATPDRTAPDQQPSDRDALSGATPLQIKLDRVRQDRTKPGQTKPDQTKPGQTKPTRAVSDRSQNQSLSGVQRQTMLRSASTTGLVVTGRDGVLPTTARIPIIRCHVYNEGTSSHSGFPPGDFVMAVGSLHDIDAEIDRFLRPFFRSGQRFA